MQYLTAALHSTFAYHEHHNPYVRTYPTQGSNMQCACALTNTELFLHGKKVWGVLLQWVISQHVKKSGLPGIVKATQKEHLTAPLLPQPEALEGAREPVPKIHLCLFEACKQLLL